jgi:hypothetical protein
VFEPLQIALWALPTAIAAFVIHATRLWLFQRRLRAVAAVMPAPVEAAVVPDVQAGTGDERAAH